MSTVKDINKAFKYMQIVTIISLLTSLVVSCTCIILFMNKVDEVTNKVYFMTGTGTFEGMGVNNMEEVNQYRIKNHVRKAFSYMFSHDKNTYKKRLEAGLHCFAKDDGLKLLNDFKRGEVYENYIRFDSRTTLTIDSIIPVINKIPFECNFYGKQTMHYGSQAMEVPIAATFKLSEVFREDYNTDGLHIQNLQFVAYNIKKEENSVLDPEEEQNVQESEGDISTEQ